MSFPRYRAAQVAIGLLIVIAIRSLAEFFRIRDPAATPIPPELLLYIYGALGAAVAALLVLILYAFGRHLTAIVVTGIAVVLLLIYKIGVIT